MTAALLLVRLALAASVFLFACGGALAWTSVSFAKRVAGVCMAMIGAVLSLATLAAPQAAMLAGVAVLLAYAALGTGLLVRIQEDYGVSDIPDVDHADAEAEPLEPAA